MTPFEEDAMPEKTEKVEYLWFGPETTRQIVERAHAAGTGACLRINAPFTAKATIEVHDLNASPEATKLAALNEAHPCPPQCL